MITKKIIAEKLLAYLQHRTSLTELVAWAELSLLDADYTDDSSHTIRNVLAHLGMADVKAFGLEWKDCESIMERLGYKLEVKALEVA
jgi:ABC-type transport system involved in cytochrome c biogenesis ATPase subunit